MEYIEDIIRNSRPWKAPGDDGLPIGLLKACGKPLFRALAALASSSFQAAYFPKRFKKARVTVLPKPNKTAAQKSTPGAWRPISLLNTVGKIVEAAFARRITSMAEDKKLLPDGQMGNRQHRSTDLAVRMVVEAAIKARKSGGIASLLQLDIKGAFDAVHHQWIIQILRLIKYLV
jgi:retron-type reverse transcriptase